MLSTLKPSSTASDNETPSLASEGGLEELWSGGPKASAVIARLPADLRERLIAIDATWLTFERSKILLSGADAPGSEAELPLFLERLDRAIELAREVEAYSTR